MKWLRNTTIKSTSKKIIDEIEKEINYLYEQSPDRSLEDILKIISSRRGLSKQQIDGLLNKGWDALWGAIILQSVRYELSYDPTIMDDDVAEIILSIFTDYRDSIKTQ